MTDSTSTTKLCPTCGTRLNDNATRCLVCGTTITAGEARPAKPIQGARMPELRLSLPAALGLLLLLIAVGGGLTYLALQRLQPQEPAAIAAGEATVTPSPSAATPTNTATLAPTDTPTPEPTWTPIPPRDHVVAAGETCGVLAAYYSVSINAIIDANGLDVNCTLSLGRALKIPYPTPTASPEPTSTASDAEAQQAGCNEVADYSVVSGDTLMGIANNYNVTMNAIKEFNGLINDTVNVGMALRIPLCERKPLDGSTPTPTRPPDYPAANLLLPANGASFLSSDQAITLQWSSVGTLRSNEAYAVTIEDVTAEGNTGEPRRFVEYVTNTSFILPDSFRPTDNTPHLMLWSVVPVRQVGSTQDGEPIWEPAGAVSEKRGMIWVGGGSGPAPAATPTP